MASEQRKDTSINLGAVAKRNHALQKLKRVERRSEWLDVKALPSRSAPATLLIT
jgi:hypothetical protein